MRRAHVVIQAYGHEEFRTQALYSAWSALAWRGGLPLDLHVYTDDPAPFSALADRIDLRVLSADAIRAWRGPHDFVHRLKPLMIRELAGRVGGGKVLYVDADAAFVAPVAKVFGRIGPGKAVLHVREYDIATHETGQLRRFRRRMRRVSFRGRPVDLDHGMWNAGAVGLDAAQFPVVDEWIAMVDEVYGQWPYWLHEQYAISQLLERAATVSAADDVVVHYWAQKREALAAIRLELDLLRSLPMDAALAQVRARPLRLPPRPRGRTTLLDRMAQLVRLG